MDILKLIPQLFYDLISRVIPGSLAVFFVTYAANIKLGKLATDIFEGAPALQESAFFLGLLFLVVFYLAGQIISPISDFIEKKIVKRLFPTYFQVLKTSFSSKSEYSSNMQRFLLKELGIKNITDINKITLPQYEKIVFIWYDWLRVNNPDAGARAAKIRAEYRMHSQNAVAFVVSLAVHISLYWTHKITLKPIFILFSAIAVVICLWAMARTYRTFQWAVINQFYSNHGKATGTIVEK